MNEIPLITEYYIVWLILVTTALGIIVAFIVAIDNADAAMAAYVGTIAAFMAGALSYAISERFTATGSLLMEVGFIAILLAAMAGQHRHGGNYRDDG